MSRQQEQEQLLLARDFIREKDYAQAARILRTIDHHPKAREWLAKIEASQGGGSASRGSSDTKRDDKPQEKAASQDNGGSGWLVGLLYGAIVLVAVAMGV